MDTQQPVNQQPNISAAAKLPLTKIILSILAIVVVGELIWAGVTLTKGTNVPIIDNITQQTIEIKPAQVILQANKQELKVGEELMVDILVDTGGKPTDGSDVILNFDPKTLAVQFSSVSGKLSPVLPGMVYGSFPINTLDSTGSKIVISGISSVGATFSGQGSLGSVTFKAIAPGSTTVAVDFILGSTVDSNIIESNSAKDILTNVKNLNLQISP